MSTTSQLRTDVMQWVESPQAEPDVFAPLCGVPLGQTYGKGLIIDHYSATMLPRRPGSRHVVTFKLRLRELDTGCCVPLDLIGKRDTTRSVGKAAREFQATQLLWGSGFGRTGRFRVPRPIHLSHDRRFILQERARGVVLSALLAGGLHASVKAAKAAGGWLAWLHLLPVAPAGVCDYAQYTSALQFHARETAAAQPALAAKLAVLEAQLHRNFESFQDVPVGVVHGDYHSEHIYAAGDITTVIDYDRTHFADPAQDLGSFLSHLNITARVAGKPLERTDRECRAFLSAYFATMPAASVSGMMRRINTFAALSSLESLYYTVAVLQVTDPHKINACLSVCLEAGAFGAGKAGELRVLSPISSTLGIGLKNTALADAA